MEEIQKDSKKIKGFIDSIVEKQVHQSRLYFEAMTVYREKFFRYGGPANELARASPVELAIDRIIYEVNSRNFE